MKRFLFAIAALTLALPALREARAQDGQSVDVFYDNLSNDGAWVELDNYGYCWQPNVASSNPDWRPYTDGYWAYTDVGWTWVSYEDFGWATYHYGRWTRLEDRGWFWVPGREWAPAWVSWRTGGDYIGWAPLPPEETDDVIYEGRPVDSHVDVQFDIGPAYYNFVDVRYIGEPVLRERILDSRENVTLVNETVNVTNITYNNSTVYNYGPDYNRVNSYSARPIQRLTLQRENSENFSNAIHSGNVGKVQGDRLVIAAPLSLRKPAAQVAPKTVREKITQPKIEHGWRGLGDEHAQTELRQKMKTENARNIAPPNFQPHNPAPTAETSVRTGNPHVPPAASTPAPTMNEATQTATPPRAFGHDPRLDKRRGQSPAPAQQPTTTATATSTPAAPAPTAPPQFHRGEKPAYEMTPNASPQTSRPNERLQRDREPSNAPAAATPARVPRTERTPSESAPSTTPPANQPDEHAQGEHAQGERQRQNPRGPEGNPNAREHVPPSNQPGGESSPARGEHRHGEKPQAEHASPPPQQPQ